MQRATHECKHGSSQIFFIHIQSKIPCLDNSATQSGQLQLQLSCDQEHPIPQVILMGHTILLNVS